MVLKRSSSENNHKSPTWDDMTGWLKLKRGHGSKLKASKRRFFVLNANHISWYTGPDKLRLVGTLAFNNPSINYECTEDSMTFPFVIKSDDLKRCTDGKDPLELNVEASSKEERQCWIRAIYKNAYLDKGGGELFFKNNNPSRPELE
ncbi:hypothetical protein Ciccas_000799 [Cichlidogyrus casuarinus]|uniref:PH domain-containing protein n=1 Tax=Cichlidogyrus casuarinus TaxID=1844966 RepID=A0ABD2QLY0_9PLAT